MRSRPSPPGSCLHGPPLRPSRGVPRRGGLERFRASATGRRSGGERPSVRRSPDRRVPGGRCPHASPHFADTSTTPWTPGVARNGGPEGKRLRSSLLDRTTRYSSLWLLTPRSEGQTTRAARDRRVVAKRRRRPTAAHIVSESPRQLGHVGQEWSSWRLLTLLAIAFVQSGNRLAAAIALGLFASAVSCALVLIAAQDRPFNGDFRVRPDVLQQVYPRDS